MLELARQSDWEAVNRLSVQIHDLHASWRPDIYYHHAEPYPKSQFLDDIQKRCVYVAKVNSSVVGYVVISIADKAGPGVVQQRVMRIDSICVDEPFRGHGIGKCMIDDVWALGNAFGCKQIILGVHPENDKAVGFYQKCGFQIRTINMDRKN